MVSERTATWAATATTADLLWHYHNNLYAIRHNRERIAMGGVELSEIDFRARIVQSDVDAVRVIVAELRRRGHSVDWEE